MATAKKTTKAEEVEVVEVEQTATAEFDPDEKVLVHLFKDGKDYKDDVFVAVNGESIYVPRGKDVLIKRKFAEVLRNSELQDVYANEWAESLQEAYRNEAAKRNL